MNDNKLSTFHGRITNPASRAEKNLGWVANALESGKFFPETESGIRDKHAPSDIVNNKPPKDGEIASAGHSDAKVLDDFGEDRWEKNKIESDTSVEFTWEYTQKHKTRRWHYFITKDGWNPNEALSRAQFEQKPFFIVQHDEQPFWEHKLQPDDPTIHKVKMPKNKKGYHVILSVWEIADTANAFYQVVDVELI